MENKEFNEVIEELDDCPFFAYADVHSCREYEVNGVCQFCGRVIPGSMAYLDVYGGE